MQICIFEDINVYKLNPLVYPRPVYDLFAGTSSLKDKILSAYPNTSFTLHCRPYLEGVVKQNNPNASVNSIESDECLFINGRLIAPPNLNEIIPLVSGVDKVYVNGETVIAARVSGKKLSYLKNFKRDLFELSHFEGLPIELVNIKTAQYPWELITANGKLINEEFEKLKFSGKENYFAYKLYDGAHLIENENIIIGAGSKIKPGAVLDASNGSIIIQEEVDISPNAVIEGPAFIGKKSKVKSGAYIYENVSIGHTCKVGGEIEESIFMPYSNKQHSGFIGHSYLGSWVNLGANTNCSDLKNNYSKVTVKINNEPVDTGLQFVGLIMGDHSKTGINTMLNTGTIAGFCSNIFGAGFPAKFIPSFSWGGGDSFVEYEISKAIETAKIVCKRRNVTLTSTDEIMIRKVFDLTAQERINLKVKV